MWSSLWISSVSAAISLIAVTLSLIALWKTHFAKYYPISIAGDLGVRIYPIKAEVGKWYIPSFDVPISITNVGARPGRILGLRLRINFPELPIPNNRECFYAKWEVNATQLSHDRSQWIEKAIVADWMPFVVLPKATVTKHLVFESRWDDPVIQDRVICTAEIYTDRSHRWEMISEWEFGLEADDWSELADVGSSFSFAPNGALDQRLEIYPQDLHKYTGTKHPITRGGYKAGATYLDYENHPEKPPVCE